MAGEETFVVYNASNIDEVVERLDSVFSSIFKIVGKYILIDKPVIKYEDIVPSYSFDVEVDTSEKTPAHLRYVSIGVLKHDTLVKSVRIYTRDVKVSLSVVYSSRLKPVWFRVDTYDGYFEGAVPNVGVTVHRKENTVSIVIGI